MLVPALVVVALELGGAEISVTWESLPGAVATVAVAGLLETGIYGTKIVNLPGAVLWSFLEGLSLGLGREWPPAP